ncbi:MAG: RHS repeat-associated core domain-containing protein [Clostridia bacterium]|nr:RHS repeat-associated core domain-containing protein [Clostridia bacterium]
MPTVHFRTPGVDKTTTWCYDISGNIVSRSEYDYTTGHLTNVAPTATFAYTYGSNWKDQLVSFNGQSIAYDQAGNPTTYRGASLSWTRGRLLASYNSITMQYDANGIRTRKVVPGKNHSTTTEYVYSGNNLLQEKVTVGVASPASTTYRTYLYNSQGVMDFVQGGAEYIYHKNIFGDIVAIYQGAIKVAEYAYDAFGNCTVIDSITGLPNTSTEFIGNVNPFRYRGYYFDTDLQLYYLMSRYYDTQTGRFINADSLEYLDPESIHGLNLFAYCGNNPVMNVDPEGHIALSIILIAAAIGFAVSFGTSIVDQLITTQEVNWGMALVDGLFGAIDGALATLGLGWGLSLLIDTALTFSNELISTVIRNKGNISTADWGSIVYSTAISMLFSAIPSRMDIGFDGKEMRSLLQRFDEVDDIIKKGVYRSFNDSVSKKAEWKMLLKKIFTNRSVVAMYAKDSLVTTFSSTSWEFFTLLLQK